MVTHVVIFTWAAQTTAEQLMDLRQACDRLAATFADVSTIRHGPDLRFRDGNGDYALVATFSDRRGWDDYQNDPRHKAFVQDFVTPILASRSAIQF